MLYAPLGESMLRMARAAAATMLLLAGFFAPHAGAAELGPLALSTLQLASGIKAHARLDASTLVALDTSGTALPEASVAQARLTAVQDDGRSVPVRVEGTVVRPDAPGVRFYKLSYQRASDRSWRNPCQAGDGSALLLSGMWNARGDYTATADRATVGCLNAAITKCVLFGYPPWGTLAGRSLRPFHLACVRMVRADYRGDGTSHTREGVQLHISDILGVNHAPLPPRFELEAGWTPQGAAFVARPRVRELGRDITAALRAGTFAGSPGEVLLLNYTQEP
jgi:hypothetical protein